MAVACIGLSGMIGVREMLLPLAIVQGLAIVFALFIREGGSKAASATEAPLNATSKKSEVTASHDAALWCFAAAMILFHFCNAPGGVYLGLFLKQDLEAGDQLLPAAFVISMIVWMLAVRPAGKLADRIGRVQC